MKIKTSDLSGIALDWAVAKADERSVIIGWSKQQKVPLLDEGHLFIVYSPSSNWSQGGPIIEREGIDLLYWGKHAAKWGAWESQPGGWGYMDQVSGEATVGGETPLIAAMRCYVASKLGEEVETPDELINKE